MNRIALRIGLTAAVTVALAAGPLPVTRAQISPKDRSAVSKAANAVQYTVRKSAANLSIDTHRALGHNSVERRRLPHNRRRNVVITPTGRLTPAQPH